MVELLTSIQRLEQLLEVSHLKQRALVLELQVSNQTMLGLPVSMQQDRWGLLCRRTSFRN